MPYQQILFEKRERVGVITLNRPERLNAWTWMMADEIREAIEDCNQDPGIGAVVITGAGRGYCSGADMGGFDASIKEREAATDPDRQRYQRNPSEERETFIRFLRRSKPIVCAINGPAVGVGLTHTLACDIRIASDRARFGMVFVRVGLTPEACSTYYLAQIVGLGQAAELILSGRIIDAEEAGRIGLVNRVVPHDSLMDEAMKVAAEIAANPIRQVRAAKDMLVRNAVESDIDRVHDLEFHHFQEAASSSEHREAVRAFLEKRPARFH